jgi:hypothetical protein
MADYSKATNFTAKDTLPTGNAGKIVKGTEIDTELTAVSNAIASKANINSPTFTGTPAAPTATAGSNTTQVANTAFVKNAVDTSAATLGTISTQNANAVTITGGTLNGVTGTNSGMTVGNATNATSATSATTAGSVGGISTPAPRPTASAVNGQWIPLGTAYVTGTVMTIPGTSGQTWAYFFSNNGSGFVNVVAGGTTVDFGSSPNNLFGFAWRVA